MSAPPPTARLHYEDTYLLRFEAEILAVRSADDAVEIALDCSAFYVESGGQPSDRGRIDGWEVSGLKLEEGVVWHRLGPAVAAGAELRSGEGASDPPQSGARVVGSIDAATRIDHMQQHSGQHILSRSFLEAGGGATRSFHLGREESTIDLDGERPEAPLMQKAAEIANRCVLENRPMNVRNVERSELSNYPLRRDPGEDRDVQRLIEIENFDWSACGGTHATRTGEVGPIQLLGAEKVRGLWRIRFLAGWRTLRYLASAHEILSTMARDYSVRWDAIPEAVKQWKAEAAVASKELRRFRAENGVREARRLHAETEADADGVRRIRFFSESLGAEELRALANEAVALGPVQVLAGGREGESQTWVAARSSELPGRAHEWDASAHLRSWLAPMSGRGGGNLRFAVGTCSSPEQGELVVLLERLRSKDMGSAS